MVNYIIIEVPDGLMVVEQPPDESPEKVAAANDGTLIDPGPYATYEEAMDAIDELEAEEDDAE